MNNLIIFNNINPLKSHWNSISVETPFQNLFWAEEYINQNPQHHYFFITNNSRSFILPFMIEVKLKTKILTFSYGSNADYFFPVGCMDVSWSEVFAFIKENNIRFDLFYLPRTYNSNDSNFHDISKMRFFEDSHQFIFSSNEYADSIKNQIKNKAFSDIQRQKRRLEKLGVYEYNQTFDAEAFDALVKQKNLRCKEWSVPSLFDQKKNISFYKNLAIGSKAHFSYLSVDNNIIAAHWGLFNDKTYYYLMPTFDEDYKRYSPGKVLLQHLVEFAHSKNLKQFDFTTGDEGYKAQWCSQVHELYSYYKSFSIKGIIYLQAFKMKSFINNNPKLRSYALKLKSSI